MTKREITKTQRTLSRSFRIFRRLNWAAMIVAAMAIPAFDGRAPHHPPTPTVQLTNTPTLRKIRTELAGLVSITYTSGTSDTVPSDWNSSSNTVHVIGAGGNGYAGWANDGPSGGGGGAYAGDTNKTFTPGATWNFGGFTGDTYFGASSFGSAVVAAKGGQDGIAFSSTNAAGGSAASSIGSVKNDGGSGHAGTHFGQGSGGGGGAGGPDGPGKAGAVGGSSGTSPGGGGGGSNGGTDASSNSGGSGNSGSGAGGNGGPGNSPGNPGGAGGNGTNLNGSTGSGGGGGGGGCTPSGTQAGNGGNGGLYGGGGGGPGMDGSNTKPGTPGTKAQGVIFITYTSAGPVADTLTQTAQNDTATFTSAGGSNLTAKILQKSTDGGSTYSDVGGQTSSPYTATVTTGVANKFRLRETGDDAATYYSNVITVQGAAFGSWNGTGGTGFAFTPAADATQHGVGTTEAFGVIDAPQYFQFTSIDDVLYIGLDPDSFDVAKHGAVLEVWWYVECSTPTQKDTTLKIHPIHGQATMGLYTLRAADIPQDGTLFIYAVTKTTQGYERVYGFTVYRNVGNTLWPARYAYVDAVSGDDSTGRENNPALPFQHVEQAAMWLDFINSTQSVSNAHIRLKGGQTHEMEALSHGRNPSTPGPPMYLEKWDGTRANTKVKGTNGSNRWNPAIKSTYVDLTFVGDITSSADYQTDIDCDYLGSRTDDPDNAAGQGAVGWKTRSNAVIYGQTRRPQYGPVFKGPSGCVCVRADIFQITDDGMENSSMFGCTIDDDDNTAWVNYWNAHGASVNAGTLHTDRIGSWNASAGNLVIRGLVASGPAGNDQNLYLVTDNGSMENFSVKNLLCKQGGIQTQIRNNGGVYTITNVHISFSTFDNKFIATVDADLSTTAVDNCIFADTGGGLGNIYLANNIAGADSAGWSSADVTVVAGMGAVVTSRGETGDYSPIGVAVAAATVPANFTDAYGNPRKSGTNNTAIGAVRMVGEAIAVPAKPTGVVATAVSSTQINVTHDIQGDADTYNTYWDQDNYASPISTEEGGATAGFSGLTPLTTYSFKKTAVNSAGESAKSSAATATTLSATTTSRNRGRRMALRNRGALG